MRYKKDNFITSFLVFIMIIIFLLTVYFCLDVFGIIEVPSKYSLASLFYSKIEVIASGEGITEDLLQTKEKRNRIIIRNSDKTSETSSDVQNPLELLNVEDENNQGQENTYNSNRFYYSQLDEYGKILYTGLYKNIDNLKTGTAVTDFGMSFNSLLQEEGGNEILGNALDGAINALVLDNPELFYIDITKMFLVTNITTKLFSTTYTVTIGGNGNSYLDEAFSSSDDVNRAIKQVEEIKSQILNSANGTAKDKIRLVHDYLIDTIDYDINAGSTVYDVYGALVNRRVVCEGYAKAFKYILDDLGIPCIIVCGTGTNSTGTTESHAWNYVQLNGIWYAVDVTWDDPIITSSYRGFVPDDIRYGNFLKGSDTFFKNHIEDESMLGKVPLNYPAISQTDY